MNIDRGPSALGLQHMAARAQEVRKQFPSSSEPAAADTGGNVVESGNSLPQVAGKSGHQAEHVTGLERAIEQLQLNTAKSPEAKGLQQALETLQGRQQNASVVDTVA